MSVEFKKNDQVQMSRWIGERKKFTLLFKASRDGCTSTAFHNKCNNKGPTVTILYNTNNSVYGGYTSVNWRSCGDYLQDAKVFLFRLYQNGTWKPVQMTVQNVTNAIYDDASYGPTFGAYDLHTFSNTVNTNGTYFPLNGSVNLGKSYATNGENYNSIANGHVQVEDLEVYLVEDLPQGALLGTPWRNSSGWSAVVMKELKKEVERYKPLKYLKVPHARFLMIGQVGAGKSSFFNTINSIFRGYITSQACSGNAEHSLTTVYRMYQVRTGISGKPMNFRLHDTIGLEADQGIEAHEICYLLDGNLPDRHQFNPSVPLTSYTADLVTSPQLSDQIHCVVFVIDGSTVDVMPEKVIEKMNSLQNRMNQRGVPQLVLLTKIDRVCEITCEDLSQVFHSPTIQETVDRVSQIMGLPRSHILPIKNYESEIDVNDCVNILALLSLQQMFHFADDFMYNHLDQLEEKKMQQSNIGTLVMLTICLCIVTWLVLYGPMSEVFSQYIG